MQIIVLNQFQVFSLSFAQLLSAMAICALQITLTVTETCAYRLGIGFAMLPFLLSAPLSIWLFLWRQTSIACLIAILVHFCSTLFASAGLIVSSLVLINPVDLPCSPSSLTNPYIAINTAWIGIAAFFKLLTYGQIVLLCLILRRDDRTSRTLIEEIHPRHYPSASGFGHENQWRSSLAPTHVHSHLDEFFA
jgi:hypothetical protein